MKRYRNVEAWHQQQEPQQEKEPLHRHRCGPINKATSSV